MLFHAGHTPDTTNYLILGYGVIFLIMGIYLWSLNMRKLNLEADLEILEEEEE